MKINKFDLISYASNFVSFLIEYKISKKINNIILYGSTVTGKFDKESDIDIFIDTDKKDKKEILKLLELYMKSEDYEKYKLRNIKNEISLKIGNLEDWKDLKRSITSNGILLYGKYKAIPEKLKHYMLFNINLIKTKRSKKVKLWRLLYGYTQKVRKKRYKFNGIIEKLSGKKIAPSLNLIPIENYQKLVSILEKNKINYSINEIWSDTL